MSPDAMAVRLHLRRIRVVRVLVDLIERLVVEVADTRRVVRCRHCGFNTCRVHDRRRLKVRDLPTRGRPTVLVWVRRRFRCDECGERFFRGPPRADSGTPHPHHPPSRPPDHSGCEPPVDPGGLPPLRTRVALHHAAGRQLVGSGGGRPPTSPLQGASGGRDQPPSGPPVCHGAHRRGDRRRAGGGERP